MLSSILIASSVGFLGYAAYKVLSEHLSPSPSTGSEGSIDDVATQLPSGVWVFKPDLAFSLLRGLGGQSFATSSDDPLLVRIAPDPSGRPVPYAQTAAAWAKAQGKTRSILAPYYMAMTGAENRYLRAVPRGQEAAYTGPAHHGFCVLLFAGT
jgi:hypothetical protein